MSELKSFLRIKKLIIVVAIISSFVVLLVSISINRNNSLNYADKISNIILLSTCVIGILSILLLIYSNLIVQAGYIKTIEPTLLLCVINNNNPQCPTTIVYNNVTDNIFDDLTINCLIRCGSEIIDYSHLFSKQMYMGPRDQRIRNFDFIKDLKQNHGINVNEIIHSDKNIILDLSFSYTFINKLVIRKVQNYIYNINTNNWDIC